MLFGESTGEAEAFELMSVAADAGAAFFDRWRGVGGAFLSQEGVRGSTNFTHTIHDPSSTSPTSPPPPKKNSAEMYPVPQRAETAGRSEEVLGRWLRGRKRCGVFFWQLFAWRCCL
jgi:hypothetical protein